MNLPIEMSNFIVQQNFCPLFHQGKFPANGGNSTRSHLLGGRLEVLLCLHVRGHAVECERLDRSVRISKDHPSQALFSPLGEGGQVTSTVAREPNLTKYLILLFCVLLKDVFANHSKRTFG